MTKKQSGITLVEVMAALGVLAATLAGLAMMTDQFSDETRSALAASQTRTFGEAANAYIKENYSAVRGVATPTTPAMLDVPTLVAAGNLTAGFGVTNAFGQSMCALILQPVPDRLQAMVVSEGGLPVDDLSLGTIAAVIGGSGGGVYSSDPSVIRGAVGGWQINTNTFDNLGNNVGRKCDSTPGNVRVLPGTPAMALWFENGDTSSAFLARDAIPGRPELNQMNTPIVMNSVQSEEGACSTVGAIAQDGAGGILSCKAGVWKASGDGKCVSTSSDLNNLQKDGRCYNGYALPNSPAGGDWVFVEVYRHINTANYYVAQRVVGMTGAAVGRVWQRNQQSGTQAGGWSAWVQQADPSINIANNQILGSGSQGSYGATTVAGQKNGWTGVEYRDSSGNYQINQMTNRSNIGYYDAASGRWLNYSDTSGNQTLDQTADMASGRLNPGWAVETWGCTTGQIAKAAYTIADGWAYNGKTLSCVNSAWKIGGESKAPGSYRYSGSYGYCIAGNPRTGDCSCPAGSSSASMGLNDTHGWGGWVVEYICY